MSSGTLGFKPSKHLKERLEEYAEDRGTTKSRVLEEATDEYLRRKGYTNGHQIHETRLERGLNFVARVCLIIAIGYLGVSLLTPLKLYLPASAFVFLAAGVSFTALLEPTLSKRLTRKWGQIAGDAR